MICKPYKTATILQVSQRFSTTHPAIDMVDKFGTFLVAPEDSVVTDIIKPQGLLLLQDNPEYRRGYGIIIKSMDGVRSHMFWHCQSPFPVIIGQTVKQGQIVAQMGNSGTVTSGGVYVPIDIRTIPPYKGTHLHYMITENGIAVDPLKYIDWNIQINYSIFDVIKASLVIIGKITNLIKVA